MTYELLCAVAALSLSTTATAKSDTSKAPLHLIELSGDNVVAIKVNGVAAKMEVEPAYASIRTVNPNIATAAALKPSMIGFVGRIGPISVSTYTDGAQIDYGMAKAKDRIAWSKERKASEAVDGTMGPGALPYDVVRFRLGPTRAGERQISFPMEGRGFFGIGAAVTILKIGGEEISVRFTLSRDAALATAPTGQLLSREFGGTLSGATEQTPIQYGVSRPVRGMKLAKPFSPGGRPVNLLAVRISDFGDASDIADGESKADPDEIVVTAKSKKKQRHELALGRAYLAGCSLLTYDFKAKQIRLSCL